MNRQLSCRICSALFTIDDWLTDFYQKAAVPAPQACPSCRLRRRLAFLNQIHLFRRTCDATGEPIISHYAPDAPVKVYAQRYWYSDAFDATRYGRDYDFTKSFFSQFQELSLQVPRFSLATMYEQDQNSSYTNYSGRNKDCYLIFDSGMCEKVLYSYGINRGKSSLDCYRTEESELCIEVIDSLRCYNSHHLRWCEGCTDGAYLQNCIGCRNCIGCVNLRQKEFYVLNEFVGKKQYQEIWASLRSEDGLTAIQAKFDTLRGVNPLRTIYGFNNEEVSGNHLNHCKNAQDCFDCTGLRDGRYCMQMFERSNDCVDAQESGEGELIYDSTNCGINGYSLRFSAACYNQVNNLTYCDSCINGSSDCFGCISLKRKKYCVLNRQYPKDDYEKLTARIIVEMTARGEWGEFFPPACSLYPYNQSDAMRWFPLQEEQARSLGYRWAEEPNPVASEGERSVLPSSIDEVRDEVIKKTWTCAECKKPYKIIAPELEIYRQIGHPLPKRCFFCRHKDRESNRLPRQLFSRSCGSCKLPIKTAVPPERPEPVLCEACFAQELG